jgi:para-aminobenzoate synthetase component 1
MTIPFQTTRTDAIQQMNSLGAARTPFLFIIDFDLNKPAIIPIPFQQQKDLLFNVNGLKNYTTRPKPDDLRIQLQKKPIPFECYQTAFDYCVKEINYGNSYLLNLTFPTKIDLNLSLKEVFYYSRAKYKLLIPNQFVCFSPETFIKIKDGVISSNPMKGTISATLPNAAETILNDQKEMGEHNTIVDFIRNDLNMVAKRIRVEQFRYIDKIQTHEGELLQVSSKIVGQLMQDYHTQIGDIIFKILPAGSISGAPKKKTLEIIKTAEQYDRGYYTGIFGYFDGWNLESAVMIRFIENINGQFVFKSGGGITSKSIAQSEYQELLDKVYVPIRPY